MGVTSPGRCEGDSLVIMPPARLAAGIALLAVATENRIRAGANAAMGYPRFGMIDLLKLLGGLLVGVFRSHAAREAEMAFLRQQLVVLQRSAPARLRLRTADRVIFVWLYRLFPSLLEAAVVIKPETLVRWHRSGFRLYWRWKSRRRVSLPDKDYQKRALSAIATR